MHRPEETSRRAALSLLVAIGGGLAAITAVPRWLTPAAAAIVKYPGRSAPPSTLRIAAPPIARSTRDATR